MSVGGRMWNILIGAVTTGKQTLELIQCRVRVHPMLWPYHVTRTVSNMFVSFK